MRRLHVRGADAVTPHQLRGSPIEGDGLELPFVPYLMVLFQILGDLPQPHEWLAESYVLIASSLFRSCQS